MSDHASESTRANERTGTARTSSTTYSTSQIAKIAGLHPNTVRMYEQWELIQKPARKQNGYRRGQEAKPGRRRTRRKDPTHLRKVQSRSQNSNFFEFWEYSARKMGTSNSVTNEPKAILLGQGISSQHTTCQNRLLGRGRFHARNPRKAYNPKE